MAAQMGPQHAIQPQRRPVPVGYKAAHKERQCMAHSPVHLFSALLLHLVTCVDRSRGYRYETSSSQNWMLPFARTESPDADSMRRAGGVSIVITRCD